MKHHDSSVSNGGFTVVDLSIVLVVIGFLIGGFLVVHELMTAARVRLQISQVQDFTMAANTFRNKYGYLPGDMRAVDALSLGFIDRSGQFGAGDGNGLITISSSGSGYNGIGGEPGGVLSGEVILFWSDLSHAGLITDSFANTDNPPASCEADNCTSIDNFLPKGTSRGGNYVIAYSNFDPTTGIPNYRGLNLEIFSLHAVAAKGQIISHPALTVAEAYTIDKKIDDAMPMQGIVISSMPGISGGDNYIGYNSESGWWAGHDNSDGYCVAASDPLSYNLDHPDTIACSLMVGTKL